MNYRRTIKIILLIVLVIAVLSFAAAWVVGHKKQQKNTAPHDKAVDSSIYKTEVQPSQLPEKFPSNIPIEPGAKVTQNYNASVTDGPFQATRVFETTKTLEENYKTYQDFLKSDGWEIKSTVNQENYKMLFAAKGSAQLQISIDNNAALKTKTVNISYTELAK